MARFFFTDRMSSLACVPPLLHGVQLFLDVLRGPVPAHAARGGLCGRGQDHEVVLPARLGRPRPLRHRLRNRAGKRRGAKHAVRPKCIGFDDVFPRRVHHTVCMYMSIRHNRSVL